MKTGSNLLTGPGPILPPENNQAEFSLLGSLLLDAAYGVPILRKEGVSPHWFYDLRHQNLYRAILELSDAGNDVNEITLNQKLRAERWYQEAGDAPWLNGFTLAAISPYNLTYYLPDVKDAHCRRQAYTAASRLLAASAADGNTARDALECAEQVFNALREQSGRPGLPAIVDAVELLAAPISMPPELIWGLLHRGSKLVLGGGSKSYKTWALLDLAVSVACGEPWLSCKTTRGRVLYVNLEIQDSFFRERTEKLAHAKGVELKPGNLDLWNLRGHAAGFDVLLPRITTTVKSNDYSLIILDPIYKLYGETDENSARDVARLLNAIERLAQSSGAAVAFGAHFSKGNQAGKESIDRISGSGVFARDPDSLLVFTRHEADHAYTVESTLRNLKPMEPFVVQWDYPVFRRNEELDPAKLKVMIGRKREFGSAALLELLALDGRPNAEWRELALEAGISRRTFYRLRAELEEDGVVKRVDDRWFPVKEAA
jgi:hypothetical protein